MTFANQGLMGVNEVLLACGWEQTPAGWLAPERFRAELAAEMGAAEPVGPVTAMAAQIQYDNARVCGDTPDGEAAPAHKGLTPGVPGMSAAIQENALEDHSNTYDVVVTQDGEQVLQFPARDERDAEARLSHFNFAVRALD